MYELYRYAEIIRVSDLEQISRMSDYIRLPVLNKRPVVVLRGSKEICRTRFELRTTADEELTYLVNAGESLKTERLSAALSALAPDGKAQIEWKEEKKARPLADEENE